VSAAAIMLPVLPTTADARGPDPAARLVSAADSQLEAEDVDAPDTCADATTESGRWVRGAITSGTDVDWYRFRYHWPRTVLTTLGHLPKDYKLEIFKSCTQLGRSSDHRGRQFEQILLRPRFWDWSPYPDFAYYVRVSSPHGRSSERKYWLVSRTYDSGWYWHDDDRAILLSWRSWVNGDRLEIVAEVMNNTPDTRERLPIKVRLFDATDKQLGEPFVLFSDLDRLPPRGRSPVRGWVPIPAGYDHARMRVGRAMRIDDMPMRRLTISPGIPFVTGTGIRHYPGTVSNGQRFGLAQTHVVVTLYNSLARVVGAGSTHAGPIPARASVEFDCLVADPVQHVNRFAFAVEGSPG
jgi:hypothetical protein